MILNQQYVVCGQLLSHRHAYCCCFASITIIQCQVDIVTMMLSSRHTLELMKLGMTWLTLLNSAIGR